MNWVLAVYVAEGIAYFGLGIVYTVINSRLGAVYLSGKIASLVCTLFGILFIARGFDVDEVFGDWVTWSFRFGVFAFTVSNAVFLLKATSPIPPETIEDMMREFHE